MAGGKLNKRSLEALIKSGAFDQMGLHRAALLEVFEGIFDSAVDKKKTTLDGQMDFGSFFDDFSSDSDNFPNEKEFSHSEILKMEKEYTGVYISGHPLDSFKAEVTSVSSCTLLDIAENENNRFSSGDRVRIGGIISGIRKQYTKRGDLMYYLSFEDLSGSMEVIVFPNSVKTFYNVLREDTAVVISGNLDINEDKPTKIRLENAALLTDGKSGGTASGDLGENPSTAYAVPLPLGKGGISSTAKAVPQHRAPAKPYRFCGIEEEQGSERMFFGKEKRSKANFAPTTDKGGNPSTAKAPKKKLYLKMETQNGEIISRLKGILTGGDIPVNIYYADEKKIYLAPRSMWTSEEGVPYDSLYALLGKDNVKLIEKKQ